MSAFGFQSDFRVGSPIVGGAFGFPGASIDMDFASGQIKGADSLTSALSITRASVGYAETVAGFWKQFASGEPRITDKGTLIEEARTNSIRNNSMQGAVAGTPGTLPTNWTLTGGSGLTASIVGTGTQNGINYVDIRYVGTPSGASGRIRLETSTDIAAAVSQVWTESVFLALVGGNLDNVTGFYLLQDILNESQTQLAQGARDIKSSLNSSLQRFSYTRTIYEATTAYIRPNIGPNVTIGQPVDFTIRIGWPQLELGSFATSPIRTTGSAATRAADVITLNNPASYASLSSGAAYIEWAEGLGALGLTRRLIRLQDASNNSIRVGLQSDNKVKSVINTSSADQAVLASDNTISAGQVYKAATRWAANDAAARYSGLGIQPTNDASVSVSSSDVTGIGIGQDVGGGTYANSYIRRITLFPEPLTDAQLEALVA